ncbi:MAG: peroxiredoxin [Pseudomonadota bacterium]
MTEAIVEGVAAPTFNAPTEGGGTLSLADLKGSKVVLFFYPKDDTSGCTKEAIAFSEALGAFETAGTKVVGVSIDSPASHDKFIAKHDLKIPLVSDEDKSIVEAYGVWVEKSMYGRKFMGTERATFLIDGDGTVRQVWRKVKVPGHVDAVLKAAQAL